MANDLISANERILAARQQPKTELTLPELRLLIAKVIAENGIKEVPSPEIVGACMASWIDKFQGRMNKQELALAFEMNVNGDLEPKVEHYQCFSREYFCNICNRFLERKAHALTSKKELIEVSEDPEIRKEYHKSLMLQLIEDRKNADLKIPITGTIRISERLNLMAELFEVNFNDNDIVSYREIAAKETIAELSKQKHEAQALNKFGLTLNLANQIARIKAGKLLTQWDEAIIQTVVERLLYCDELRKWEQVEFIEHVKSQID